MHAVCGRTRLSDVDITKRPLRRACLALYMFIKKKASADRHHADETANLDAHLAEKKKRWTPRKKIYSSGKESE